MSNRIKRINDTGNIEGLRSKKQPGRPARLSEARREELKAIIRESPEKYGIAINIRDGKSLSACIHIKYGIVMKTGTCRRLFHQSGFPLKRARPVAARSNEKKKIGSKKT